MVDSTVSLSADEAVEDRAPVQLSPSYLRRVLNGSRSVTVVIDLNGVIRYASAGIGELLGVSPAQVVGATVFDWLHPDDFDRAADSLALSEEVGPLRYFPMTFRLRHAHGHDVELDVLAANHFDDPELAGVVLNLRRADERSQFFDPVHALASGASHGQVLELIASGLGRGGEALRPAFIASDRDPVTGRFAELHTVRATAGVMADVREVLDSPGVWQELAPRQLRSVAATDLPAAVGSNLVRSGYGGLRIGAIGVSGKVVALLVSVESARLWQAGRWSPAIDEHWYQLLDLATVAFERHRYQSRLLLAATHDSLTGLANRARFFDEVTRIASRSDIAVLYLDLDGFKAVNDGFGHARGDDVLVEVGRRLRATVRPGDLVARLGGDEFAVAVAGSDPRRAADLAERLVAAVGAPLPGDHPVGDVGVSIGVCYRRPGQTVDDVVNCADSALLTAKRHGRGGVVILG